jgi:alpha-beta hydrolase superfamily lysophospholipase
MPTRPRGRAGVLIALATVSLASFAFATSADARPTTAKPTVVLVHGAFADSSGFGAVIDRLRHDGYPVRAAPNPLVDLQSDAATVRGFLDSIKGPKILVGHSYGGAVITQPAVTPTSRRSSTSPPSRSTATSSSAIWPTGPSRIRSRRCPPSRSSQSSPTARPKPTST